MAVLEREHVDLRVCVSARDAVSGAVCEQHALREYCSLAHRVCRGIAERQHVRVVIRDNVELAVPVAVALRVRYA